MYVALLHIRLLLARMRWWWPMKCGRWQAPPNNALKTDVSKVSRLLLAQKSRRFVRPLTCDVRWHRGDSWGPHDGKA
jgi:hypothetical protein